jgi:exopolyphosphatase / guanosine-5'-triphosphate,3'-diphosphate pyrophosphatase
MPTRRHIFAVIDAGSNSIRLRVARALGSAHSSSTPRSARTTADFRILLERREATRLGQDLQNALQSRNTSAASAAHAPLSPESMLRSADAIARLAHTARESGATALRAVATAAVREARNRDVFLELVRERAGLDLEVLSELDEARLAYEGVAAAFDLSHGIGAVADIGGGSLEVVLSVHGVPFRSASMPLGAVRLTKAFGGPDAACTTRFADLRRHIRTALRETLDRPAHAPTLLVGTGGTFSSLAWLTIAKAAAPQPNGRPNTPAQSQPSHRTASSSRELPRAAIGISRVKKLIDTLRSMSTQDRLALGVPADRADIIVPGLVVVHELLKFLRVDALRAHDAGLRDGVLHEMLADAHTTPPKQQLGGTGVPPVRNGPYPTHNRKARATNTATALALSPADTAIINDARALAKRCRYEKPHSEQVARLALSLFDQLAALPVPRGEKHLDTSAFWSPRARALLEAACVLHDIGIAVEYRAHHKHSRDIIRLSPLRSMSPRERELVAVIARYHRKSTPEVSHADWSGLSIDERDLARRLAAIERVADALDRGHRQLVRRVRLTRDGSAWTFELEGTGQMRAELAAAARKSDLFTRVFHGTPTFTITEPARKRQSTRAT